ncbi:MAG: hypothetical protein KKG76_07445 [Euryarchaeota archaeon]|nr:hypothetical protein [Euryarchaeota archaeon]MBU4138681.1 hypothetical protein [Euryarchaeota archaeon]
MTDAENTKKTDTLTTCMQSCSGCQISILDLHEEILDVLNLINLKYAPVIMDVKVIPKVTVALVAGAVANSDNEEKLKEIRKKSDILIALGSCAAFGGIAGMRNLNTLDETLTRGYVKTESTVDGKIPRGKDIPRLLENVKPLNKVVKVDFIIPGCPPTSASIKNTIVSLLSGQELKPSQKNLCNDCPREQKDLLVPKREFITDMVYAPCELETIDPEKCFLEQGVICMGPATLEGCGSRCMKANMPCRGCMGPSPNAMEQGCEIINALSSIIPAGAIMFQDDIVGTGYRYTMASSIYPHISKAKSKKVSMGE